MVKNNKNEIIFKAQKDTEEFFEELTRIYNYCSKEAQKYQLEKFRLLFRNINFDDIIIDNNRDFQQDIINITISGPTLMFMPAQYFEPILLDGKIKYSEKNFTISKKNLEKLFKQNDVNYTINIVNDVIFTASSQDLEIKDWNNEIVLKINNQNEKYSALEIKKKSQIETLRFFKQYIRIFNEFSKTENLESCGLTISTSTEVIKSDVPLFYTSLIDDIRLISFENTIGESIEEETNDWIEYILKDMDILLPKHEFLISISMLEKLFKNYGIDYCIDDAWLHDDTTFNITVEKDKQKTHNK